MLRSMNQDSMSGIQVTLDTNVLQEYWIDRAKKAVVERLLALAAIKDIDLAITARVREDIPERPLASEIDALPELGVHETGSVTRLDYWVLDRDHLGSEEFEAFRLGLESAGRKAIRDFPTGAIGTTYTPTCSKGGRSSSPGMAPSFDWGTCSKTASRFASRLQKTSWPRVPPRPDLPS
jgi:hypothetical protein